MNLDLKTKKLLVQKYGRVRRETESLCTNLKNEDFGVQSMQDCSPIKWHLAHTTWFFETFVLEGKPFHPEFSRIFNSYYQTFGSPLPREQRGLLTRPTVEEIFAYRAHVDEQMQAALDDSSKSGVITIGLHHEQQHQELMLMDLKNAFSQNPLRPAYREPRHLNFSVTQIGWEEFDGGLVEIGHIGEGFGFDNEFPRHKYHLIPFAMADRLVTNGEVLQFIQDGGYATPSLWLSDGWHRRQEENWTAPLYWEERDGAWWNFTLSGMQPLSVTEPVSHLSYYEAEAVASWKGCRLPTEQEWEVAARESFFGKVWQWTRSPYMPYPGYREPEGAIGEYNGKFMANQFVLRGGSFATPEGHIRTTYRNFFYPHQRWPFTGLRLARDRD